RIWGTEFRMSAFVHQIASGAASGLIYACLALALVMIYQATGHVNFAQGEMAMFSTYVAWLLVGFDWPYWAEFVVTLGFSFMLGCLIERVILRPLSHAPVISVVIVFVGLLVIFNSMAGWLFGYEMQTLASPFPEAWRSTYWSAHEIGLAIVTGSV